MENEYKICPICNLNYISNNEESCKLCADKKGVHKRNLYYYMLKSFCKIVKEKIVINTNANINYLSCLFYKPILTIVCVKRMSY